MAKQTLIKLFEEFDPALDSFETDNDNSNDFNDTETNDEDETSIVTDDDLNLAKDENPEFVESNPEIADVTAADVNDFIEGNGMNYDELVTKTEGMTPAEIAQYLEGNMISEGFTSGKAILLALAIVLASCSGTSHTTKRSKHKWSNYKVGPSCSKMRSHNQWMKESNSTKHVKLYEEFNEEEFSNDLPQIEDETEGITDSELNQAKDENPDVLNANPEIDVVTAEDVNTFLQDNELDFDQLASETEGMSPEEIVDYLEGSVVTEGMNSIKAIILALAIVLASCSQTTSIYKGKRHTRSNNREAHWNKKSHGKKLKCGTQTIGITSGM